MKRYAVLCIVAVMCISISFAATAYRDDFAGGESKATIFGLVDIPSVSKILLYQVEGDDTAVGLAEGGQTGTILYHVTGAETIKVGFYSAHSGYATVQEGYYLLGYPNPGYQGDCFPVYLDRAQNLYCRVGNKWMKRMEDGFFADIPDTPTDILPYPLYVQAAEKGQYTLLANYQSGKPKPIVNGGKIVAYYEERIYTVPKNAEQIQITLCSQKANGPVGLSRYPVMVANVEIVGVSLSFEQQEEPSSSNSSSSKPDESSSSGSSSSKPDESSSSGSSSSQPDGSSSSSSGSTGGGSSVPDFGSSGGGSGGVQLPAEDGSPYDRNSAPEREHSSRSSSSTSASSRQSSRSSTSSSAQQIKPSSSKTEKISNRDEKEYDSSSDKLDIKEDFDYNEEKRLYTSSGKAEEAPLIYYMLGGYCVVGCAAAYIVYQKNWKNPK